MHQTVTSFTRFLLNLQSHQTPLHLAAEEGHPPVVKVLLERGANVMAVDAVSWRW